MCLNTRCLVKRFLSHRINLSSHTTAVYPNLAASRCKPREICWLQSPRFLLLIGVALFPECQCPKYEIQLIIVIGLSGDNSVCNHTTCTSD